MSFQDKPTFRIAIKVHPHARRFLSYGCVHCRGATDCPPLNLVAYTRVLKMNDKISNASPMTRNSSRELILVVVLTSLLLLSIL